MTTELDKAKEREQNEEIQIAETKLVMHKELLEKDEKVRYDTENQGLEND